MIQFKYDIMPQHHDTPSLLMFLLSYRESLLRKATRTTLQVGGSICGCVIEATQ